MRKRALILCLYRHPFSPAIAGLSSFQQPFRSHPAHTSWARSRIDLFQTISAFNHGLEGRMLGKRKVIHKFEAVCWSRGVSRSQNSPINLRNTTFQSRRMLVVLGLHFVPFILTNCRSCGDQLLTKPMPEFSKTGPSWAYITNKNIFAGRLQLRWLVPFFSLSQLVQKSYRFSLWSQKSAKWVVMLWILLPVPRGYAQICWCAQLNGLWVLVIRIPSARLQNRFT